MILLQLSDRSLFSLHFVFVLASRWWRHTAAATCGGSGVIAFADATTVGNAATATGDGGWGQTTWWRSSMVHQHIPSLLTVIILIVSGYNACRFYSTRVLFLLIFFEYVLQMRTQVFSWWRLRGWCSYKTRRCAISATTSVNGSCYGGSGCNGGSRWRRHRLFELRLRRAAPRQAALEHVAPHQRDSFNRSP